MLSSASLFSGCGGSDTGLQMAGYTPIWACEYDRAIADLFKLNHEAELVCADILEVRSIPSVDLLWVSPPCPSFSIANQKRGETANDIALAKHIATLVVESNPRHVAIENVPGYVRSKSFGILYAALVLAGYQVHSAVYNAADYGVPQTRRRLIVRASREELYPIVPTHSSNASQLSLFGSLKPWITWLEAIEGIPLKSSELTENQVKAIGKTPLVEILVERAGYRSTPKIWQTEPAPTIRSHVHYDDRGSFRIALNAIVDRQCYAANIQCLAAWQSFPRDYLWGEKRSVAAKAIGNAVPPLLAQAVAKSFSNSGVKA